MPSISRRLLLASAFVLALGAPAISHAGSFVSQRISVTTEGEGSDVILIPGLGSSPRVWRELVRAVPGYRYHLVHVAGFAGHARGQNGQGDVAAPVAEEIARYISAGALVKPAVIGHSMGGTMGMMIAARHPQALSRLMVVDMSPFLGSLFGPPGTSASSVRPTADALKAQMSVVDPAARQARSTATLARMIDNIAMRPGALDDTLASDQDVVARAYHELVVTDLRPELARIAVPVTVLYVTPKTAGLSDAATDAWYRASYMQLKGASLRRIPASSHFIMWDQSQQFQSEVKAFLQQATR